MHLNQLLGEVVKRRASDLHLRVGRPPLMRISGDLVPSEFPPLTAADMRAILSAAIDERNWKKLEEQRELDFGYEVAGVARFRFNVFYARGNVGAVARAIPLKVFTIDGLGLPPVLKDLANKAQGIVLVTGPTGSGKSTTLSAIIQHINQTSTSHIVTIEDPIEFVYEDEKSTITQRELGRDTLTVHEALRAALRQDPDVILTGEMRDRETIELAMHAAETGHLVFSTLHTNDSKQTVDRIIDSFPAEQHQRVRRLFALALEGIVSQRLIPRADGQGRVAAIEIMVNSPNIRQLIEEGDTHGMAKAIEQSQAYYRMQSFNQALAALVKRNLITEEEAMKTSATPGDLKLLLKGMSRGSDSHFGVTKEELEKKIADGKGDTAAAGAAPAAPVPTAQTAKPGTSQVKAPAPPRPKLEKGFSF